MTTDILQRFGDTIRFFRNEAALSQEKLADKCGFHRTYIGQVERGERNPSLKSIEVFAKTFGVSLTELFEKVEK